MIFWISDPVSDVLTSGDGSCKDFECGKHKGCDGVKCKGLKKCGCYGGVCSVNIYKKKKKGKKK